MTEYDYHPDMAERFQVGKLIIICSGYDYGCSGSHWYVYNLLIGLAVNQFS